MELGADEVADGMGCEGEEVRRHCGTRVGGAHLRELRATSQNGRVQDVPEEGERARAGVASEEGEKE